MATGAIKAKGILLQRSSGGSPDVFITIGEVVSFNGPTQSLPVTDATSFDSTWAESLPGVPDGGEMGFSFIAVPSNVPQAGLEDDLANGTLRAFRLVLTDASSSKKEFSGYVTAFTLGAGSPNEKVVGSCTIRISGGVS